MPLRPITIRMSEHVWDLICEEADAEGVSVAQYVRESALARVWYVRGKREPKEPAAEEALQRAIEEEREE